MNTTTTAATARRPSSRLVRIVSLIAIPAAVAVSGLVVSQASYSAYSATTVNPASNWTTGTVALADDDANVAAFSAVKLKPGSTGAKCIAVTSSGTVASVVKLYGTTPATTKNLSAYINLTITQGSGGSFGTCTGFVPLGSGATLYSGTLDSFGTSSTNYTNGVGTWAPTGTAAESRTYQVSYTVSADAPDSTQGGTAALGFAWEAQNS